MENLRKLDMTRDEIDRIGEALKDKEFRKLLVDYVEELQDPETKRRYEEEVTELERQRGYDITFVHPTPGYVIKTSVDGSKKAFINVCASELINKPSSTPAQEKGSRGLHWTIPHSPSPPREDVDKKSARCVVFDVVFHPDTLHIAQRNKPFKEMVNKVACQAVEDHYDVKLDGNNLKFPKIEYKGRCDATVIRKPSEGPKVELSAEEQAFMDKIYSEIPQTEPSKPKKQQRKPDEVESSSYTTPKYNITHRSHIEMQDFTYDRDCKINSAIPHALVVHINLPLLSSSADLTLDVDQKTLQLVSEKPAKYKLILNLPYAVSQNGGNAKFDKDAKQLIVTLPVQRKCDFPLSDVGKEQDSGVESDHGSLISSSPLEYEHLISEIGSSEPSVNNSRNKTESQSFDAPFLDPEILYTLPEFITHMLDRTVAFTLNVKNAEEYSVQKQLSQSSFSVKFTTISSGFYPVHYALHAQFPGVSLNSDNFAVEVWDNNVIVQVTFDGNSDKLTSYSIGADAENMREYFIQEPSVLNEAYVNEPISSVATDTKIVKKDKKKAKHAARKAIQVQHEWEKQNESESEKQSSSEETKDCKRKTIDIGLSESSGDEFSYSSPSKGRGILKNFSRKVPRSVSESNLDDYVLASSVENFHASYDSIIPEEEEVSTSLKKTVRFNNIVSRKLYRSNSSILGQRKKNQRKAKAKKRAHDRRCSESEVSESEEKKDGDSFPNSEEDEIKSKEANPDIFHLDM